MIIRASEPIGKMAVRVRRFADGDLEFIAALASKEDFLQNIVNQASFLREECFVAFIDERMIGLSTHLATQSQRHAGVIEISVTGVRRECRGRGIAKALKLMGMRQAQARGFRAMVTHNHSFNDSILRLNEILGFVREPARIEFHKCF